MSLQEISPTKPVKAKKRHVCNYCGCHIEAGETYNRTVLKYDDVYTWKSHPRCDKIANKLNMFDDCDDEGIGADYFQTFIQETFIDIWREKDIEYYESKSFVYPKFKEQLDFVCQYHAIGIEADTQ